VNSEESIKKIPGSLGPGSKLFNYTNHYVLFGLRCDYEVKV